MRAYTPDKTLSYENMVSWIYQQECKIKLEGNVSAEIYAYFPIPKSVSKKKRTAMALEYVYYNHKPDTDNLAKIILDSLNGIAYDDDRQVCELKVVKFYSNVPRVHVKLREIEEDLRNGDID